MTESFWGNASLEPKRAYRWIMLLGGIPQWVIKKVNKPSWEVSETPHDYLIHKFYYPGRVTWNEVKCTLVDPVTPDAAASMHAILVASGYPAAGPVDAFATRTISKQAATTALGRVEISQLGAGEDEVIESWVLRNAWIKNVSLGELDYSSDDMVNVELTIRYDWAEQTEHGPVAGAFGA